ncbi:MAG: alanine--tRNA ligase, partial [Xanthomonadales bacterium]|nr:alanine--tRNA ligase [Xanthomonadales bacterium]
AFRLYDTYGFPVDLTADIARERGLEVDMDGFETAMQQQRERARSASRFQAKGQMPADLASQLPPTQFLGYATLRDDGARVLAIVHDGRQLQQLGDGEEGMIILERTPFYAESGGQVGDSGTLRGVGGEFEVTDTVKMGGVFFAHRGGWRGAEPLRSGAVVAAQVDAGRRQAIVLNHSATHLLHAALRKVLGTHVTQKGSLVAAQRLRFDFSHPQSMTKEQLHEVEAMVNAEVRRNVPADVHEMAYDDAITFGAMALFGEKYSDQVRVLKMGEFSTELCGGTHVKRSGDIGVFKMVSESGVASGVRRIEAVTGQAALDHIAAEERCLDELSHLLSSSGDDMLDKLRQTLDANKQLQRELESMRSKAAGSSSADLAAAATNVGGYPLVAARLENFDVKMLRDSVDQLKQQLGDCVVLLAGVRDGKASLVAGVHGKALDRVKAGDIVAHVAGQIGGKGGGRADMAQGGGEDSPMLVQVLQQLPTWLSAKLD